MVKIRALLAAACAIGATAAAHAAPIITYYPATFTAGTFQPSPTPVTTGSDTQLYEDIYTFATTADTSTFSGSLTTRAIRDPNSNVVSNLNFQTVYLDGMEWTPDAGNNGFVETWSLPSSYIGASPTHSVYVYYTVPTADANNGASYGGVFNLAVADVPEPASWAMMVGGFGMLGAAMRRGRRMAALAA